MIYLDYSATTPTNKEVIDSFSYASTHFFANPNSLHKAGGLARDLIESSTKQIADILNVLPSEIIYTSGASESNNLAIKGLIEKYKNRGKHIITTRLEHSSIYAPISYLQKKDYEVDFVNLDKNGMVDLEHLKTLINDDTVLVTISSVNSEIGIRQDIAKIANVVKTNSKCFFHVDATQSVGKEKIDITNVDLVSFSAHKFFGIKGIGCLIKKEKIELEPLIHGGGSTTIYRSGTPAAPLISSLAKALRLSYEKLNDKTKHVSELNSFLKKELERFDRVKINSNEYSIPHILNFSLIGVKPETLQHALEEYDIYISTKTACSSKGDVSGAVMAITNDKKRAMSSLRISISYMTTLDECETFIEKFTICYNNLTRLTNNENN